MQVIVLVLLNTKKMEPDKEMESEEYSALHLSMYPERQHIQLSHLPYKKITVRMQEQH